MADSSAAKPSYVLVRDTIRNRVLSGEWKPGERIPTERELEREFSLSRMTISKGLANLVAEGYLLRKQGHGTFVAPDQVKESSPRLIKYISPQGPDGKAVIRYGVLEAMHDVLADNGYDTGIDFYRNPQDQNRYLHCVDDTYHAGFLIFFEPGEANVEELRRLHSKGFPFVLLDSYPLGMDIDSVVTDNIEGGRMVVEHLAGLGHRHIAYVTRPVDRSSLSDRLSGFLKGLVLYDLPFSDDNVIRLQHPGDAALSDVDRCISQLMDSSQTPSAIMFSNDDLALEAIECLRSRGIQVPQDVSIVGYDNVDHAANAPVPLTTVVQDFYLLAHAAAEKLVERLEHYDLGRNTRTFIKPRLIIRQTTACFSPDADPDRRDFALSQIN